MVKLLGRHALETTIRRLGSWDEHAYYCSAKVLVAVKFRLINEQRIDILMNGDVSSRSASSLP